MTTLSARPTPYELPPYSLTGDLLAFLRCGLQYRYGKLGHLPATRPLQLWFGQFLHATLEEAFRRSKARPLPWSEEYVAELVEAVTKRLAAQGLYPWDLELRQRAHALADVSIRELGPHLFPLIAKAEVRLTGTRNLPKQAERDWKPFRQADRYEVVGVVDVLSHVELTAFASNPIVRAVLACLDASPPSRFEVIVDYKGSRRPPSSLDASTAGSGAVSYWDAYEWQVQTYAHLREKNVDSERVVAGSVLYLNELLPSASDIDRLVRELDEGRTDVVPPPGSSDEALLAAWPRKRRGRRAPPELSFDFRLQRALRAVSIDEKSVEHALGRFDEVVTRIEACRSHEFHSQRILSSWETNASDVDMCTACDARTVCTAYSAEKKPRPPMRRRRR